MPFAFAEDAHTFADILIKPCVLELATCVLGEQSRKELEIIQLYSNNVRRRIQELSTDIEKQLVSLRQSTVVFSLQLDQLTIVSWLAVLPV